MFKSNLLFLIILISSNCWINAQTNIEFSIPVGLSNISPKSIEEHYDYVNEPLASNAHISSGFEIRLAPWSLEHFEFFIGVNYLRMQYKAEQKLSRESFAWTIKHTKIKHADHFAGINLLARVNFISKQKHKAGLNLNFGYMYGIWTETWIDQEEHSFFGGEREYNYYKANNDDYKVSVQYGFGLAYTYGKNKLRWIFEAGYNYLNIPNRYFFNNSINDWKNYYFSAGIKYYFILPEEEVLE